MTGRGHGQHGKPAWSCISCPRAWGRLFSSTARMCLTSSFVSPRLGQASVDMSYDITAS